ncbi:DoxX-like family protein [Rhodoferax saidenbachensis]|uniref:Epimerase n=1 Tax=Rhodoferax saidenbachensis TaxID=1484693 RepID=A0A1P8KBV3_9BURK|nr:DoxX-like family protein [Rhodoferax saidenbachensis]APW43492.1 epimerase [Rhodoferax saidenbachensis]
MTHSELRWLRYSLVFVWLATAVVSVWELHGQSRALLLAGGVTDVRMANTLTLAGAVLDVVLGLLLLLKPVRRVYGLALLVMLCMTVVASAMVPALWLHPLGPLTKNLPIAAVLWVLMRRPA